MVAVGVLCGVLAGVGATLWVQRDATAAPAAVAEETSDRVAELQRAEAERDLETLEALAAFGVGLQDELADVLGGLLAVDPPDGSARELPTTDEVDGWVDVLHELAHDAEDLPLGATEHNMVRLGLILSLEAFTTSAAIAGQAVDAEAQDADALYELSGSARDHAIDAFGMAAMQLDLLHIAADKGHLHIVLRAGQDGAPVGDPHHDH